MIFIFRPNPDFNEILDYFQYEEEGKMHFFFRFNKFVISERMRHITSHFEHRGAINDILIMFFVFSRMYMFTSSVLYLYYDNLVQ